MATFSSLIYLSLKIILSLNLRIWGEVYFPTLYLASSNILSTVVETEPLPLVPVICITLYEFCGFPKYLQISLILSKPSLILNIE